MLSNFARVSILGRRDIKSISRRAFCGAGAREARFNWCADNSYENPVKQLEELVEIRFLNANETAFSPSVQEIKKADDAFRRLDVSGLNRIVDASQLPVTNVPEVSFIGQSNVGKSSLIKSLLNNPQNVKLVVSKNPGRTTTLNFYTLGQLCTLVDVPGYGENMPAYYVDCVEDYIKTRESLVRTFLLIDGATGISDVDRIGIEMMEEFKKPYSIVMTKIDKASHHVVLRNLVQIKQYRDKHARCATEQIFLVSAHQGAGIPFLRSFVMYATGNLQV